MAALSLRRVLTIAIAAAAICGCGKDSDGLTRVGTIGPDPKLVETVTAPLSTGEALVRANMAQGLVRFDERGQVVPGLAERWNVSDDGLSYIFRLQTGEWPDGRKIRADDIAKILSRQLRPASANPLKDTLGAVSQIVAMTDRVIEIRLSAPRPNLLQLLAQPEFGLVRASVGTGPFTPPTKGQMEAAKGEIDEKALFITHRIRIPDAEDPVERVQIGGGKAQDLVAAFANGDLDLVLGGTVADLPYAMRAKVPRGALRFDPVAGLFGLAPTKRSEVLQNKEVRQLLSRAIDRQAMVGGLNVDGLAPRATLLQAGMELRLTSRRAENLLAMLVIPAAALLFFGSVELVPVPAGLTRAEVLLPGACALAVIATGLVNLGIATAYERQYGVLKRWRSTEAGTTIDGLELSSVTVGALGLRPGEPIRVRFGVRPDAGNVGGINIFGREFGNYPQDLGLRIEFDSFDSTPSRGR